jgi:hypothetical protein
MVSGKAAPSGLEKAAMHSNPVAESIPGRGVQHVLHAIATESIRPKRIDSFLEFLARANEYGEAPATEKTHCWSGWPDRARLGERQEISRSNS